MDDVAATPRSLKHVAVREYVRSLVEGAEAGAPAPSERELVQRFGVARMTVRQAMDALVSEGLLERMPGRGTFVARPRRHVGRLTSVFDFSRRLLSIRRRGVVGTICWVVVAGSIFSRSMLVCLQEFIFETVDSDTEYDEN